MKIAFPKTVWEYYHCEEPQWSVLWWVYGKPESKCPTSVDVFQVVAFYLLLLCIICFLIQRFVGIRNKGYCRNDRITNGCDGDFKELLKNMDLNNNNRFQSYDYPMDRRERFRLRNRNPTCLHI